MEVSLKILVSGIIQKTFTHVGTTKSKLFKAFSRMFSRTFEMT